MYKNLLKSLDNSDLILVCPVYKAGESDNEDFSPEKIAEDAQRFYHKRAKEVYNVREVVNNIPFNKQKNIIIQRLVPEV